MGLYVNKPITEASTYGPEPISETTVNREVFFNALRSATSALKTEDMTKAEIDKRLRLANNALQKSKDLLAELHKKQKTCDSVELTQYIANKCMAKNMVQSVCWAIPAGALLGITVIGLPFAPLAGILIANGVIASNENKYEGTLKKLISNNEDAIEYLTARRKKLSSVKEAVADTFTAEDYFANLGKSRDMDPDKDYESFFKYPEFNKAITEHFDISDELTRKALIHVNEADQSQILTSLTSRLYENIVDKADDIDYGDIPATKGDITKLPNYEKIVDCINILRDLMKEYKQDTGPVEELSLAIANLQTRKELFAKAYRYNIELPMMMYCNAALSIITGVSYLIATSIEFIKSPNQDSFEIVLDKMALTKSKENMIYSNLKKFNRSCENGDMDKALNGIIMYKIKGVSEAVVSMGAVAVGIGVITLILNIIPILREMVFFFFYTRTRVSDFLDIQADLLQMNAYNLEHNEVADPENKEKIVKKQLKIVDLFRRAANSISIAGKQSEVKATKDIYNTSKKMKYDDVMDELPDGAASALF